MTDSFRVELRDVTKRFGETIAVDNLTLQILSLIHISFFSIVSKAGCELIEKTHRVNQPKLGIKQM